MLRQLIYVSTSENWKLDRQAVDILDVARSRNAAMGVTGLLVFARGAFFQILEGAPEAVEDIFESIKRDRRHRSIITLIDDEAPERLFGEWSMGWREPPADSPEVADIRAIAGIDDAHIPSGPPSVVAKTLLITFLDTEIT